MNRRRMVIAVVMGLLALAALAGRSPAAGEGTWSLEWWSVDGGGGQSAGGPFELHGAIGQADAGQMAGGLYELWGGFWVPLEEMRRVPLPLILR